MYKCKASNLVPTIWPMVKADIPVFIQGPSGVGKSAMIRHGLMPLVEEEFGAAVLHDFRLSSMDITDGTGLPIVDQATKSTVWTRPALIPHDDGKMHVIFLDEIGHASVQLQHAIGYRLVWDRALGEYKLPKNNRVILAYNTKADKGGDNKLAKPFENRGAHVLVEADVEGWLRWATEAGINRRLVAFIKARPALLHRMDENNPAWPSPRAIANLSKVFAQEMQPGGSQDHAINAAVAICGEGFARQLEQFMIDLDAHLPKLSEIAMNPEGAKVPKDLHHKVMVADGIADSMATSDSHFKAWVTYLKRLPADVASSAIHKAITINADLKKGETGRVLKKLVLDDGEW